MNAPGLRLVALRRYAGRFRPAGILALVFVAGFVTAWLWPDHSATSIRISGTVIWSNTENGRILLEGDDSADDGEYEVAAIGRLYRTGEDPPGRPACLTNSGGEFVRTDRRRVELDVVSVGVADSPDTMRIAVVVRCVG